MSSKATMIKSIVMTLALAAIPGIASADDSSTNPFAGESYAFNRGNVGRTTKPLVFDRAPSAWRQVNPAGLSERQLQALSSYALGSAFQHRTFGTSPSTFARTHPHGLSERELQVLSSPGPAWQSSPEPTPSWVATKKSRILNDSVAR